MNRFFLLPLLMPLAAPCVAGEFARTDAGCQVMNWNASRVSPTYTWTGNCVDGYAAGKGVWLSFVAGALFSTTEGSMTRGVFNGPSKIQWADTTPSEPSGDCGLSTTLSMLGALAIGAGQGYASSDALRASQLNSLGNALSQVAATTGGASTASASGASYSSSSRISSEVANMDFSGGCLAAQQKGEVYLNRANQRAQSQEMGVCSSAKHMRMAGEIAVRVAEQCQNTADGPALLAEGERMIQEAEQTMSGSCG